VWLASVVAERLAGTLGETNKDTPMYRTHGYPIDLDVRVRARARRRASWRCSPVWSRAARWFSI